MFFTCLLVDDYLVYDIGHYLHTWPSSPPEFDITKWTQIMKAMIKIHHLRSEHLTFTHRCQCLSKRITCLWASSTISSVSCNMESKPTLTFQAENLFPSYFIHHTVEQPLFKWRFWGSQCEQKQFSLYLKNFIKTIHMLSS